MSETAHFLQTLNKQIKLFKTQCETGTKNHDVVYNLIRNIMESLAGLFESIGLEDKSVDIRKMAEYLTKIVVSGIQNILLMILIHLGSF